MVSIRIIVLTDDTGTPKVVSMMFTTPHTPPTRTPIAPRAGENPWLLWRPETPGEPELLTVAQLAECRCPDLCDRDHDND